ncbi:TlpA family protein disulfide reductase [Maribacter sp. MMG018]|uniref:TlpA family protein disulfide reductase n=1 Tax=Maribacter sp. MMG018 TaxID=2822688 RepID=UPI001B36655A|nr:TlpA disulfide reductase family protein [Maribacter sp. MMG018]MBQ4913172.1 TlpA family protein disulfide reductase [Maribacter sp. MMG018]
MDFKKIKIGNVLFWVFIVLMIVPQTRSPIMVAINKVRVLVFSPDVLGREKQGQLEPFTYKLTSLDGTYVDKQIGKGNVVFISYWATWCPPCIAEMPSIQSLYEDYGDKVDFLLISNEDPEVISDFLEKKQFGIPAYVPRMNAPYNLFERTLPTNYIIDKEGKIVVKEKGASDWNSQKIRNVLDMLLDTSVTPSE